MLRHEMKEIKLPVTEEDLNMLEEGFENLTKYHHPLPWRWLQPRGLGADIYILGGKEEPYIPVCNSRLSFPQNDFIVKPN